MAIRHLPHDYKDDCECACIFVSHVLHSIHYICIRNGCLVDQMSKHSVQTFFQFFCFFTSYFVYVSIIFTRCHNDFYFKNNTPDRIVFVNKITFYSSLNAILLMGRFSSKTDVNRFYNDRTYLRFTFGLYFLCTSESVYSRSGNEHLVSLTGSVKIVQCTCLPASVELRAILHSN